MFISFLYMFWVTMHPSSEETTIFMWHLVLVILYGWHSFLVCLFLFSTCFGRLCAYHQEKQLYLCDTWYLLFCMDDCLVCRVEWKLCTKLALFTRLYKDGQSTKHNKKVLSHVRISHIVFTFWVRQSKTKHNL
jgi:hypothetical protein